MDGAYRDLILPRVVMVSQEEGKKKWTIRADSKRVVFAFAIRSSKSPILLKVPGNYLDGTSILNIPRHRQEPPCCVSVASVMSVSSPKVGRYSSWDHDAGAAACVGG